MASGKMGLVGIWDAIGFDEVRPPKDAKGSRDDAQDLLRVRNVLPVERFSVRDGFHAMFGIRITGRSDGAVFSFVYAIAGVIREDMAFLDESTMNP